MRTGLLIDANQFTIEPSIELSVDYASASDATVPESPVTIAGRESWRKLFTEVQSIEDLVHWESTIPRYCECEPFYQTWKKQNPPGESIDFAWKYRLRSAVNAKLGVPNIHLEDAKAQWLHIGPQGSKRLILSMATGPQAMELHAITGPNHRGYAFATGADYLCLQNRLYDSWQLEKLRASFFANQYDWILWVDNDLFFMPNCPDIFEQHRDPAKVYGVDDADYVPSMVPFHEEMQGVMDSQGLPRIEWTERMINSGMILASRQSASWAMPPQPLPLTHCSEQLWHDYLMGDKFEKIDRRWNWQAWQRDFASGLSEAYIVHLAGQDHAKRMQFVREHRELINPLPEGEGRVRGPRAT
jgi:hypothetical protein